MKKIISLNKTVKLSKDLRERSKAVGLILGSFDVLHMGHIDLFRFAKKHCDYLIIGLDNDETVKITKGEKRPINNYKRRGEFLSELKLIDYIFKIDGVFKSGDESSFGYFEKLVRNINPTHIFTSIKCDDLWKKRRSLAKSLGIKFLAEKSKVMHTSDILKILEAEI
ncbi:MAG TPA: adenylyltransferase/cytidyltransferase family protein [Alphaproteobacteria bacterium]|jgi:cytidyltransferase-like protein|nr:adenylyltransferase/cytidyltransferase family protein [Alphaproteobacteria bacterium]